MKYVYYLKDIYFEKLIVIYIFLLNDYVEWNLGWEYYEFIVWVLFCICKLNGG